MIRSFTKASGGRQTDIVRQRSTAGLSTKETAVFDLLQTYDKKGDVEMTIAEKNWDKIGRSALQLAHPDVQQALVNIGTQKALSSNDPNYPFNNLTQNQRNIVLRINSLPIGSTEKSTLQKNNISWLKPYWEANTNYFAYLAAKNDTTSVANLESTQPRASEYVQSQMDAKNWNDPQVKAYLDANTKYKNDLRLQMGLPEISSGSYQKKPYFRSVSTTAPKMKKLKLKKLKKFKKFKLKKAKIYKLKKTSKILSIKLKKVKFS
jgi:hypothetical protein